MDVWVNESVNHCMNESMKEWTWIDSILPLIYDSTNLSTNSESRYTVLKAILLTQHNTKHNKWLFQLCKTNNSMVLTSFVFFL